MLLLPVLDLLHGAVVRGIAGKRETYRPIQSQIVESPQPLAVARAFRENFGLETLYVADLDAILASRPNFEVYEQLARDGFRLWVDAGVRDVAQADAVLRSGAATIIAGLESTQSPQILSELVARFGSARIVFSLDLKLGQPLTTESAWGSDLSQPLKIVEKSLDCGVRRLIVLDLAQVGINQGLSTLPLCQEIRRHVAKRTDGKLELITGGGVRNVQDLRLLAQSGLDGTLIASAFHNGQIRRNEVEWIQELSHS